MTRKVNLKKLQKILQNVGSCKFVGLITETEPAIKSPKTSGMAGRIKKISEVTLLTGDSLSYESVINRRRKKVGLEAVEQVKPRKWGQRIPNTPFVIHNGQLYLETQIIAVGNVKYLLDGKEVPKEEVKEFLTEKKEGDIYGLGKDQPIWRDYKLGSIREVRADKHHYIVENE